MKNAIKNKAENWPPISVRPPKPTLVSLVYHLWFGGENALKIDAKTLRKTTPKTCSKMSSKDASKAVPKGGQKATQKLSQKVDKKLLRAACNQLARELEVPRLFGTLGAKRAKKFSIRGLNLGPFAHEASALPLSHSVGLGGSSIFGAASKTRFK